MAAMYIVVSAAEANATRIALGMLGAQYLEEQYAVPYEYPMPGPTYFIWGGEASLDGTEVAFGPPETGIDPGFGAWCLGRVVDIEYEGQTVSVTIPSTPQSLERTWFATPQS